MPIDYSKWDHFDEGSDCDSDTDGDDTTPNTPRVTRLEAPTSVTFGGHPNQLCGPAPIESQISAADTDPVAVAASILKAQKGNEVTSTVNVSSHRCVPPCALDSWTEKGGSIVTSDGRQLHWSQNRYSVHFRVEIKSNEAVQRVQVKDILPYADRHCAMGSHKHRITITGRNTTDGTKTNHTITLLEGDLPHPVHWSQDDDTEADSLDWTIDRKVNQRERRFALITLYKAVPMQGMFVWWKRPLLQFNEIVWEESDNLEQSGASKEFHRAWESAHQAFRDKERSGPQTLPT